MPRVFFLSVATVTITLMSCSRAPSAPLCNVNDTHEVQVYEGTRFRSRNKGELTATPSRALQCAHPIVRALRAQLQAALVGFPKQHTSTRLVVHADPQLPTQHAQLRGIEVQLSSGALLIDSSMVPELPRSVWRHELVHATALRQLPKSTVARRLVLTIEEGIADFVAARLENQPLVGTESIGETRDLSKPLTQLDRSFETLSLPGFTPHVLSRGLARALWGQPESLRATAALRCLRSLWANTTALSGIRDVLQAFVASCPAEQHPIVKTALMQWVPQELRPQSWHRTRVGTGADPNRQSL